MEIKKGSVIEVKISDLAFGGKGIAKIEMEEGKSFVVFVNNALPGQTVEVKITKKKKNYAEGKCVKILEKSELEVENEYQEVPGAPWASLPIETQREFKQKQVFELFKRFADIDLEAKTEIFDEYIESPEIWNYRNKMEYSFGFSDESFEEIDKEIEDGSIKKIKKWDHFGFALGSKKRGQFWLVENLEKPSGLFDTEFENFLSEIKIFCEETGFQPYNPRKNEGFFRYLLVRKSFQEDKFLISLITTSEHKDDFDIKAFSKLLNEKFEKRIGGIFWQISDDFADSSQKYSKRTLICGKEKIIEKINGLEFEISLDSFFQTNIFSAEKLYEKAVSYLGNEDGLKIFDLFCGTGTIAQIISKTLPKAKVYGVEIVQSAITDAKKNAIQNRLEYIKFFCADVGKFLQTHPEFNGTIDALILDPPRAGITPKTLKKVIELKAKKMVYVSCNPATFARDTKFLTESGYMLKRLSLADQFPHTSHVECVGEFEKG